MRSASVCISHNTTSKAFVAQPRQYVYCGSHKNRHTNRYIVDHWRIPVSTNHKLLSAKTCGPNRGRRVRSKQAGAIRLPEPKPATSKPPPEPAVALLKLSGFSNGGVSVP